MTKQYFTKLIKDIKPNLSLLSILQYTSVLNNLYPDIDNDKSLKDELTMSKVKEMVKHIEDKYTSASSRGFKYNCIITVVKHFLSVESDEYLFLSQKRDECNSKYLKRAENGLSDKDKLKMVTTDEYKQMLKEFKSDIEIKDAKHQEDKKISKNDFMKIQEYYLALIYFYYGFRVDVTPMIIIFKKKVPDSETNNYLQCFNKKYTFILNAYKTSSSYGQKVIPIDDRDLINGLNDYVAFLKKYNDRSEGLRLFSTKSNSDFIDQPNLSNLYTLIFKTRLNKAFTFTLNRKRIVSSSEDVKDYVEAKKKVDSLASTMMNSVGVQQEIYNTNKDKNSNTKLKSKKIKK